ncbi:hypothetical protein MNBD_NITROSPINAE05-132 [hydrothermal vent metagenome]|uniref:Carboxymuconolactone decarboxylase-like domain-containing protein n=1 Tax=hydrothermal vent metagenome TaxID=652676 RepID=A0A3B1CR88_9ZZZZ
MFRINSIPEAEAEGRVKKVYDDLKDSLGMVPNIFKALSLWPRGLELYVEMFKGTMFAETKLTRGVKEMIAATVSKTNECDYCLIHHTNFMTLYGISPAVSEQIVRDPQSADISKAEKRLLAYVKKVTQQACKVTDADVESLKEIGWSEEEILEATMIISLFNSINRVADALGVQLEV